MSPLFGRLAEVRSMKGPIVYASMALAVLLAVCVLLATQFYWEDSSARGGILRNEDFGTGLLRTDLRKGQVELIESWAQERDFKQCDTDRYSEIALYSFEREDGLWLSYGFCRILDSGYHSLSIMLIDEGTEQLEPIEGVPAYMMPGVSREEVEEKLGLGIVLVSSEGKFIGDAFDQSEIIVYHGAEVETRRVRTGLFYMFVNGHAKNVTLRIGRGVPMPTDETYKHEPLEGTPWGRLPPVW